jgi:hypothetical protein
VPRFAAETRSVSPLGQSWPAQGAAGEPRGRRSQAETNLGGGWMFVITVAAAIMAAVIAFVFISADRDR